MASYNLSVGSTSTSGLLNTNNEYVKFKIQVKLTSQSTSGNTSNVDVSLLFSRTNSGYSSYSSDGKVVVTINGTDYTSSWSGTTKTITYNSNTKLFSKTGITIPHGTDGKKTFTVSLKTFTMTGTGLSASGSPKSASFVLPTIPRESSISWSSTTMTLNGSAAYFSGKITPKLSSAQHSLILHFKGKNYTLLDKKAYNNTSANSFNIQASSDIVKAVMSSIPKATSVTGTVEFITYSSGTKIGNSSSSTYTFKIGSSIVPKATINTLITRTNYYTKFSPNTSGGITASSISVSSDTSDDSSWSSNAAARYIPGLLSGFSSVSARVSGSIYSNSGTYLSQITTVISSSHDNTTRYTLSDAKTEASYSSGKYYNVPTPSGSTGKCTLASVTVQDLRGKQSTTSVSRTVYKYISPSITKFTAKLVNDVSTNTEKISCNISITATPNIALWVFYRYKKTTDSTFSNWFIVGNGAQSSTGNHTYSSSIAYGSGYQVQFAVYDATGAKVLTEVTTPQTGNVLIGISSNGLAMTIGGPVSEIHDKSDLLDIRTRLRVNNTETTFASTSFSLTGIPAGSGSANLVIDLSNRRIKYLSSSRKYKENIDYNLDTEKLHDEFIKLKPVKFNYKSTPGVVEYGLIAEDVYDINPEFTNFDIKTNEVENFKDRSIIVLLINELQRSNKRVTELEELVKKLIQK